MRTFLLSLLAAQVALAAEAPISLTASDGAGLKLVKLDARAVVQDPLAFTELQLAFENPLDRQIEGQFKIVLPPGAAVSRFAMKVDNRWQEGEVVERQAARRAYEDFLHRRQDPALLEQGGANEFTARVFPIPARGIKEIVVSYSHELASGTAPFVLPLAGLPEVGELEVHVAGVKDAPLSKKHFVPTQDYVATPVRAGAGVRSGEFVVARVVPVTESAPEPVDSLTVLVDSSASRALGYREQLALTQKLFAELAKSKPDAALTVACFDQTVKPIYEGKLAGFGDAQVKAMRAWSALGASNVQKALEWAAGQKKSRVLLVTDGVATAGETEGQQLIATVLKLKAAGIDRIDAIAVGGIRDESALARLTTAGLKRDGAVLDGALDVSELARRLQLSTRSSLEVKVAGASWSWPKKLNGVQPGDTALVYASVPPGAPLSISIGGKSVLSGDKGLSSIERPLVQRAWAKAKIASLLEDVDRADGPKEKAKLKEQIVALSTQSRVLSPYTALLVLETEADYARFNIDRRALADVLTVENGRVTVMKRSADSLVATADKTPPPAKNEAKPEKPSYKGDEGRMGKSSAKKKAAADEGEDMDGLLDDKETEEAPKTAEAAPAGMSAGAPAPAETAAPPPPPSPTMAPPADRAPAQAAPEMEVARPGYAPREQALVAPSAPEPQPWEKKGADPYTGKFKDVMDALERGEKAKAVSTATGWHEESPGDLLALVAMGTALEAQGDVERAARCYGSIIDLFPARADLRRFAGVRLEKLAQGLELAADTFGKAEEQRPDHPASHRLYAYALLKQGQPKKAFEAIERGMAQQYPSGRFLGVDQILREDAGLIAAAWIKAEPSRRQEILERLHKDGGTEENAPSIRFVLNWETDANDVDFHITDSHGGHAWYSSKHLPSGGDLYADVTTGYGPECFTIRLPPEKRSYPYKLQAHYYSIGPMGAGMGKLQIIDHDGKGNLKFEERPYVVMVNQAFVDLGVVKR